jgi:hypothetical protein
MVPSLRDFAISRGWIKPAAARSTIATDGGPTPLAWVDRPTLRLDGAARRAMQRDSERASERRQPREDRR